VGGGAISPVGVPPTRTVGTSASIIFPCSIKIQKTGGGEPSLHAAQPYAKAEGRVFLLVQVYPGCPGTKAVKRLLLLLLLDKIMSEMQSIDTNCAIGFALWPLFHEFKATSQNRMVQHCMAQHAIIIAL